MQKRDNSIVMSISSLTEPQRQAATHVDGPALVLAGPGSGKTRVITHRVAYLIEQGIHPFGILAITFTNKAAEEMRNRLRTLQVPRGCTICTFHSLAARLLREFAAEAGLAPNFSIFDSADQKAAMRVSLKACELDAQNFSPGAMLARISNFKNNIETPEQVAEQYNDFYHKKVVRVYAAYQKQLHDNAALDFDDLLMKLALLLRDNSELRNKLNERYRYILVDEYQDTNHSQYQIARGLALSHENMFVTGDPDQSIYGWRGADIGNILAFEEDYPRARVIRLEENFRSTPQVLDVADQLIQANQQRKEKKLFTSRKDGTAPRLIESDNEYEEAREMAEWVKQLHQGGMEYREVAVFYRVNSMSRVLEEALRKAHIPYQIIRGVEFFKRKEIKDMIAYLRLLVNPADQISLKRIINQPSRGIGNTTLGRLFSQSEKTGRDIWYVLNHVDEVGALGGAAKTRVGKFVETIINLQNRLEDSVSEVLKKTYELSGMQAALAGEQNEESAANVEEMINSASQYEQEQENPSLADYLQQIALVSDADAYDEQAGAVSLMTLHAAKGLEFPAVFIVGVEEGLIPHTRSADSDKELEEERRLLFVGITRAEEKLCLSYARNRTVHGVSMATIRSQFLRNLSGLDFQTMETSEDSEDDFDIEPDPYESKGFSPGQLVRHPTFGLGRVSKYVRSHGDDRVTVQFNSGARKTLFLKYAKLEKLSFPR